MMGEKEGRKMTMRWCRGQLLYVTQIIEDKISILNLDGGSILIIICHHSWLAGFGSCRAYARLAQVVRGPPSDQDICPNCFCCHKDQGWRCVGGTGGVDSGRLLSIGKMKSHSDKASEDISIYMKSPQIT